MYFSKAILSREAFGRDHNWQLATNGYRGHQLVWSLFSDNPDRERDFIFRWDTDEQLPVLHTVSERKPVDREGNFRELQAKPYDPKLTTGQQLQFRLRANAVVKKRDEQGRQQVHDVVMNAKYEMRQQGSWEDRDITQAQLVHREGFRWLNERGDANGYAVSENEVTTESHQRHEFRKSEGGRQIVISTIDYRGTLRVTDPERFYEMLMQGLGPSKAFGCGMMLVRPVR